MQSRVVTTDQAGDILQVSRTTILTLLRDGKIKNIKNIHPHKIFYVDDLLEYAEKNVYKPLYASGYVEDNFLIFESKIN
jgi:predicted site-specific integrase-resolvase